MSEEKEKQVSIGALWEKSSSRGTYFSGSVEVDGKKIPIVVFKNGYKKESKHPDWKIYVSKPRDAEQSQSQPEASNAGPDDDLPF